MSNRLISALAAVAFAAPLLVAAPSAQQAAQGPPQPDSNSPSSTPQQTEPAPAPDRNSVQVGVPLGRGGAQGQTTGGLGRGRQNLAPVAPPRNASGRVLLGAATPKEHGVWIGSNLTGRDETVLQPWTRAIITDRRTHELEPHTRCKASAGPRQFLTPYGAEIVEIPALQRIYIFDIGGPHTFRTIYMDGRSHPANLEATYYGHSIGWWEGDTLVVDTIGFTEGFWIDRGQSPHTEALHMVERFTRHDANAMQYEMTVEDPGAYTRPWTATMNLRWEAGTELFEYVCQQQNYAHELMVGEHERVDRTTLTIP